ncbi:transcriptional regulator family: Fungal Specific TF [Purpureocillium lilacinum]|uniref:Transcriptional regulator family: Fungal Specific TF n=1 Tax=Purpureocillium lilacinum TaxID=33203 RepID=A0ABR0BE59_PURLI|nr:transcriptional regulator family: Fungal Specific TF [Purpureocillium lilacinum]
MSGFGSCTLLEQVADLNVGRTGPSTNQVATDNRETEPDNLQPSGLLDREALKGKFSLQNVLRSAYHSGPELPEDSTPAVVDPIQLGLLNVTMAKSLFENFMVILNPYICQLDPCLHTFAYVRKKSAFLLSAILAVSSKFLDTSLYGRLYRHAQNLFTDCFRRGSKSTEIVQAILTLTYWKEPQDTRVFTSLGYAIRMCFDMGWHKLVPHPSRRQPLEVEDSRRVLRNIERTWYVLFVYDRSMSLQTGKPWMIACDEFMDAIEAWCDDSLATQNDLVLGALVTLRLATATEFTVLIHGVKDQEQDQLKLLLSILGRRIDRWETEWSQRVKLRADPEDDGCHQFLIHFYASHIRLQLFSLPLQGMLVSADTDTTLHLDTFLFLAPRSIADPIKSNTIEAIRTAGFVFSSQSGQLSSSCELQARFLNSIATKLAEPRQRQLHTPDTCYASGFSGNCSTSTDPHTPARNLEETPEPEPARGSLREFDMAVLDIPIWQQGFLELPEADSQMWSLIFTNAGSSSADGTNLS